MTYQNKEVQLSNLIIPKLQPVFNDTKNTHIIITSGRAGTKSSFEGIREPFKIVDDPECSVVIMRKFHNKLRKTVYKEMIRGITRLGINKNSFKITSNPMEIKYKPNGNTMYFTGNDSIDDTKGMIDENKPIKRVIVDEITEFFDKGDGEDELANIEATFVRGNDNEFQMIYLFNPPKNPNAPVMKWLEKMVQRDDCIHIHLDYRDVPEAWLGKKLIESAEQMKLADYKMYKWVWLGLCIGLDEIIYYMFDENKHVNNKDWTTSEIQEISEIFVCGDYGQMNPTVFEFFGMNLQKKIVMGLDEYSHSGREEGQKTPSIYAKEFRDMCLKIEAEFGKKPKTLFLDPSAKGLIEEIKRVCPWIKVKAADNAVSLGISRMQKVLSFIRIKFSYRQKTLLQEIRTYQYDKESIEKGKELPLKENDHAMDAVRYGIMMMWKRIKKFLPFFIE